MKNFKLILSFAIVLAITMYSCKKDLSEPHHSPENELMTHSQKVLSLIRAFDNKLESSLKTGGLITLDSAVWYTEALQNYEYAHPDSGSQDFIVFKSQYTLAVSPGGLVLMDDVETLYGLMEVQFLADIAVVSDPVKFLVIADVALDSTVGNTAHISVSNGLGVGEIIIYDPFEEEDDWIWGTGHPSDPLAGKCDTTEIGESDGSNELADRLNNPNMSSPPPAGYTDVETVNINYMNCYFKNPLNIDRVFNTLSYYFCIEDDAMNDYLDKYDYIIYHFNDTENDGDEHNIFVFNGEGARPVGKNFISVEIEDAFNYDSQRLSHFLHISYGIPYYDPAGGE